MALTKAQKAARAATAAAAAAHKPEPDASAPGASVPKAGKTFASEGSMGPKIRQKTPEAPAVHDRAPAGGGRMVIVVCKMPRGIFLQHHDKVEQDVRVMGGGIEKRKVAMPVGPQVRLKPSVLEFGMIPNYTIVNGFSFTPVDANFWNIWYQQNSNFGMLEAGLLCAFDNEADAKAYCLEYGALKHGLEPLAQKDDPRVDVSTNPNVSNIDIDTDAPPARN